jgi:hypothetical protein
MMYKLFAWQLEISLHTCFVSKYVLLIREGIKNQGELTKHQDNGVHLG